MPQNTVYIFLNLCNVISLMLLIRSFMNKKYVRNKLFYTVSAVYYLLSTISFVAYENANLNLILLSTFFITLSLCFNVSLQRKIIVVVSALVFCMVCDLIIFTLFVESVSLEDISAFSQIMSILLTLLTANIAKKVFPQNNDTKITFSYWLLLTLFPIGTITILVLLYTAAPNAWQCMAISAILLVFNICIIIIYNIALKDMENQQKTESLIAMNKAYQVQLETIEATQNKISELRHDMKNHILSIQTLWKNNQEKELDMYFNRFYEELKVDYQWANTHDVTLDSFINYKLFKIHQLGAKIDCKMSIEQLGFDIFDLSIILGNLFDNAYEALQVTENKMLGFEMSSKKSVLHIKMSNTTDKQISKHGGKIVTDKSQSELHGFGINNIKNSVAKYDGVFDITQEDNEVSVNIMLYAI